MHSHVEATGGQAAWRMALGRQPAAGRRHHSERESPSACQADQRLLADAGLRWSLSRQGDGRDHAGAARVLGSLKRARTAQGQSAMLQEAQADVINYNEMFATRTRLHSYLDYV
jgi:transposase InsO family protein